MIIIKYRQSAMPNLMPDDDGDDYAMLQWYWNLAKQETFQW